MNREEADVAVDALHTLFVKINSKRAGRLVVADHDQVLTKMIGLAETAEAVVAGASALASETFSNDPTLVARLSDPFKQAGAKASSARTQLLDARRAIRREVLEHRDEKPPRGSRRSPWVVSPSGNLLLGPIADATAATWALTRPRAEGNACDLSAHFWLAGGLSRVMGQLWSIGGAEETNIWSAYSSVGNKLSGERAQESVRQASKQWHQSGMAFIGMLEILRRRARQRTTAARRAVATSPGGGR